MIGYLKGKIVSQDLKSIILDVGGVGYEINTNTAFLDKNSDNVSFWTYLAVRENSMDLYGFGTKEELDFFKLLISVSGIGPKSALGILGVSSLLNLKQAISSGDTTHLTKVSGIGRKNAEKIVIELKDKITFLSKEDNLSGEIDVLEALKALGYGERESREVLKKVSSEKDISEKIKKAMKLLS